MVEEIVELLRIRNETISFMESCTGGYLANQITNVEGSSDVLKVSLVTYSDEYKIEFGVSEDTINERGVYSKYTSKEMAERAAEFAESDWGIGITGVLGDEEEENFADYTIYYENQSYGSTITSIEESTREKRKAFVCKCIFSTLLELLQEKGIE